MKEKFSWRDYDKYSEWLHSVLKTLDEDNEEYKKEIERLNKRIEDLNIINEEHRILNGMIRKQLKQKENIIKEAREYKQALVDIKEYIEEHNKQNWYLESRFIWELLDIVNKALGSDKE